MVGRVSSFKSINGSGVGPTAALFLGWVITSLSGPFVSSRNLKKGQLQHAQGHVHITASLLALRHELRPHFSHPLKNTIQLMAQLLPSSLIDASLPGLTDHAKLFSFRRRDDEKKHSMNIIECVLMSVLVVFIVVLIVPCVGSMCAEVFRRGVTVWERVGRKDNAAAAEEGRGRRSSTTDTA